MLAADLGTGLEMIQVVQMTEKEIPDISNLFYNFFLKTKNKYSEKGLKAYTEENNSENLLKQLQNPRKTMLVAKNNSEVIGVNCGFSYGGVFYHEWIIIKENWRGKGVGRKMFEELENGIRHECHNILVQSNKKLGLENFFKKLGFRTEKEVRNFWWEDDYLLFTKRIQ